MEEMDSLNFLIRVQGELKRYRELADRSSDRKLPRTFTALPMKWSSGFGR
jgi:hypothetical protein